MSVNYCLTFPQALNLICHNLLRRSAPSGQQHLITSVDADGVHSALVPQTTEGLLQEHGESEVQKVINLVLQLL